MSIDIPTGSITAQPLVTPPIPVDTTLVDDPVALVDDPTTLTGSQTTLGSVSRAKTIQPVTRPVIRLNR